MLPVLSEHSGVFRRNLGRRGVQAAHERHEPLGEETCQWFYLNTPQLWMERR